MEAEKLGLPFNTLGAKFLPRSTVLLHGAKHMTKYKKSAFSIIFVIIHVKEKDIGTIQFWNSL